MKRKRKGISTSSETSYIIALSENNLCKRQEIKMLDFSLVSLWGNRMRSLISFRDAQVSAEVSLITVGSQPDCFATIWGIELTGVVLSLTLFLTQLIQGAPVFLHYVQGNSSVEETVVWKTSQQHVNQQVEKAFMGDRFKRDFNISLDEISCRQKQDVENIGS